MNQVGVYIILFGIIVIVGQLFNKSRVPLSIVFAIAGILLSFVPNFPNLTLNPNLVLNIFLPLLIYQISSFSSWKDIQKSIRPIAMLSVGHVIFITFLIAIVIHFLIPQMGWPLAFVLGAVISPPDDVAIVSIAEKIRMPEKIITILEGEAIFNDATALVLFRFALTAAITHTFSVTHAISYFFVVVIGETIYGLIVGTVLGELRLKMSNPNLHIIASLLTPLIAYFPVEMLGGSGILSTAVTGFVIGHRYAIRFLPDFRLYSRAFWPTLSFVIQSILFLLIGLNMGFIFENISSISTHDLILYGSAIILTVIIGRFIWVYVAVIYFPRLFSAVRNKERRPPWQYPFIVSWAGMRGIISLAAALAVPAMPMLVKGVDPRDLLLFLVICVIAVTFILQGLTLPWLLNITGVHRRGKREEYDEHITELKARLRIVRSVLRWLGRYKKEIGDDPKLLEQVKLYIREYQMVRDHLKERIAHHDGTIVHDQVAESVSEVFLVSKIIEIEREELLKLWQEEKINLHVRNKLLERLDHRTKHLST